MDPERESLRFAPSKKFPGRKDWLGPSTFFKSEPLCPEDQEGLLARFKKDHVDEQYPRRILLANHLLTGQHVQKLTAEQLKEHPVLREMDLLFYDERAEATFPTSAGEVVRLTEKLKTVTALETDGFLFDAKLLTQKTKPVKWFVRVYHEDQDSFYLHGKIPGNPTKNHGKEK